MNRLVVGAILIASLLTASSGSGSPPPFVTKWRFRQTTNDFSQISDDGDTGGPVKMPEGSKWGCKKVAATVVGSQLSAGFDCSHESGARALVLASCERGETDSDMAKVAIGEGKMVVVFLVACQTVENPEARKAVQPIEHSL